MTPEQLSKIQNEVIDLCKEVGAFIKNELYNVSASDIEEKDMNSLVSYVDKTAEKMIVSKLQTLTPDSGFITEEDTVAQEKKEQVWIIDPLDGTTNFLHKIPHFSISIALMENDKLQFGAVYEIMLDNIYTAIRGGGAFENGKQIFVRPIDDLSQAIVVTGFPYKKDKSIDASLNVLKFCVLNCRGVRRLGSAALDLAYVASGKIDIYYENTLNIWDVAAGALLVQEAGGKITDYDGYSEHLKKGSIIASNKELYPHILKAITSNLA